MPYLSERNVFVCQQFLSFFVLFSNIKTNKIQLKVGFQRMKQTVHNFIAHWLSLETTQHLIISLIAFWDSSLVNVFIYFHMLRYHFYSMRTKVISVSRNYWTAMTGSLFFFVLVYVFLVASRCFLFRSKPSPYSISSPNSLFMIDVLSRIIWTNSLSRPYFPVPFRMRRQKKTFTSDDDLTGENGK